MTFVNPCLSEKTMKKLICIFFATASIAYADTFATYRNSAGGQIVLTDVPCDGTTQYVAYASSPRSDTLFGCWFSDSTMIHVTWKDGSIRSYEFDGWNVNMEVAKRLKAKNSKNI